MQLDPRDPRAKLHYVVGISLGVGQDPTGWAVLMQHVRTEGWYSVLDRVDVGHLERMPLDTSLPDLIKYIHPYLTDLREKDFTGQPEVIVNVTHYGGPSIASFNEAQIPAIKATIKGRDAPAELVSAGRELTIGTNELMGATRRLLEHGRLQVYPSLSRAEDFKAELAKYDPHPPRVDRHDPEAWRDRPLNDLVCAVALAAWWSEQHPRAPKTAELTWNRKIEEHNRQFAKSIV
jgi:hypothetical protein